jgi:hypothetical protein
MSSATINRRVPSAPAAAEADDVREAIEDTVKERPWLQRLARSGWVAKGVVYVLMGITAVSIGRNRATNDKASPEGAIDQVAEAPGGAALLWLLLVGLGVYVVWRLVTAALVRGNDLRAWLTRLGFLGSALFYLTIGLAAGRAVLAGGSSEHVNAVERLSSRLLASTAGRWVLLALGAVVVGVGLVFVFDKAIRRHFRDDLHLEDAQVAQRRLVVGAGVLGWLGRGLVTSAVGVFVLQAAWTVDRSDARGFDRALRELASRDGGGTLVAACGVALVAYGLFCWLSLPYQELEG